MPIDPTGTTNLPAYDGGFWVKHANGVEFEIKPYTAISTGPDSEAALQSLVTHLQSWPDLEANFTVTAGKSVTTVHAVTSD